MSKIKATERMLFGPDPYTSKSLMRLYGGYNQKVVDDLFLRCREVDGEKTDIDLRPGHVLKSTFFKVAGINMNQEIKRYNSIQREETK